jgi:hypothetical protein
MGRRSTRRWQANARDPRSSKPSCDATTQSPVLRLRQCVTRAAAFVRHANAPPMIDELSPSTVVALCEAVARNASRVAAFVV